MGKITKQSILLAKKLPRIEMNFIVLSLNITKSEATGLKRPQLHCTTCGWSRNVNNHNTQLM